eukprot:1956354-Rhodomonas_salina.1
MPAQKPNAAPPVSKSNPSWAVEGKTALVTRMTSLSLMLASTTMASEPGESLSDGSPTAVPS